MSVSNGSPQVMHELFGVIPRIDNTVILSEQFFARILGDGAELVIHIGHLTFPVGNRYNRVFIQCQLKIFGQTDVDKGNHHAVYYIIHGAIRHDAHIKPATVMSLDLLIRNHQCAQHFCCVLL